MEFVTRHLPVQLSDPAGGRAIGNPGSVKMPPWGRAGESIWGILQPSPYFLQLARAGKHDWRSCCGISGWKILFQAIEANSRDEAAGEVGGSPGERVKRIRLRALIATVLLIALWLGICAFVMIALWMDWKL